MIVYLETLGCAKNRVDTEVIAGIFQTKHKITENISNADIVLLNTCAFIKDAYDESLTRIKELVKLKKSKSFFLIIAGCLVQGYANDLKSLPIDLAIGPGEIGSILELIKKGGVHINRPGLIKAHSQILTTGAPYAYLKVAEGCSRGCGYCTIPRLRGPYREENLTGIIKTAKNLVHQGARELNLVAQDLSLFSNMNLLLEKLEELSVKWIRLLYFYPENITKNLLFQIKSSKKVCKYLDIPIQHLSDKVLLAMRRNTTKKQLLESIDNIRKIIPDVVLRTSVIVGHPGEDKASFNELKKYLKLLKFDYVTIFKYSLEKGTPSARLKQIAAKTTNNRFEELTFLQQDIMQKRLKKMIGKNVNVLVENYHPDSRNLYIARHQGQAPEIDGSVIINRSNIPVKSGNLYNATITDTKGVDLVATLMSSYS